MRGVNARGRFSLVIAPLVLVRGRFSLVITAAQSTSIRIQKGAHPEGQAPQSVRFVKLLPS